MGETEDEHLGQAGVLFENFVQASTCKGTLQAFSILCRQLDLDPLDHSSFYSSLKAAVSTWKVKPLWTKLDKRAQQKVYNQNKACQGTRVGNTRNSGISLPLTWMLMSLTLHMCLSLLFLCYQVWPFIRTEVLLKRLYIQGR